MEKLRLECTDWRPLHRNTLQGFASIRVPAMRLTILDLAIHAKGASRWAQLPSKAQLRDGALVRDDAGKVQYFPVLEFDTGPVLWAFSHAVVDALLAFDPHALDQMEETTS